VVGFCEIRVAQMRIICLADEEVLASEGRLYRVNHCCNSLKCCVQSTGSEDQPVSVALLWQSEQNFMFLGREIETARE
jgi:hypothetical protein